MFGKTKSSQRRILAYIKDDFTLSTWLYLGAFLQSILFIIYPYRIVVVPSVLVVIYRTLFTLLMQHGIIRNPLRDEAIMGRYSAQVVNADGTVPAKMAENQIVVFILGSSVNTAAKGHMTVEDNPKVGSLFAEMWSELSKHPAKWGCKFA